MRDERIDLVRGAAVVCMVQFHTIDSFASPETKASWLGQISVFFGGGAAPLFLTLAGLGAGIAYLAKGRVPFARGVEIWSLGMLFRVQEWALGGDGASSVSLIRVDVLNCIGISLVVLSALMKVSRKHYVIVMLAAAAFFIGLAPALLSATFAPAFLRYYVGGPGHLSLFPLFPWTGMACLGAAFSAYPKAHYALGTYGIILAARMLFPEALHFAPLNHDIVFALERCSLSLGLIALAHLFPLKRVLKDLGDSSLLIYWVHVELVYGLWFHSKKGTLLPASATLAALAIIAAMWGLTRAVGYAQSMKTSTSPGLRSSS